MRQTFDQFLPQLLKHEGGYVDHPRDPGGATNLGVTLATLSRWRGRPVSKAEVRALQKDEAGQIYRDWYWNKIDADSMLAGPDAALFDVAVNSGPGRAKSWAPLTVGKDAVVAVKAVCARRRAFFRSLRTFDVFGKGWMRRVNEVEAWSIAWAVKVQGGNVRVALDNEAKVSDRKASTAGATAGAGGTGTVATAPQAAQIDWITLIAVGVPVVLALSWLVYVAVSNLSRASAMKEQSDV
jgi:lysozyme family protein